MTTSLPLYFTAIICLLLLSGCQSHQKAEYIELPSLFSDHMVFQRNAVTTLWGKATPNKQVTVTFKNQRSTTIAQEDSTWRLFLAPEPEGGPHELSIIGTDTLVINDVLIGEVWVASGQSNMQWSVQQSNNSEYEIKHANYPNIRLFSVDRTLSVHPKNNIASEGWQPTTPSAIQNFSAVAYYFGRTLHDSLNVPIGLIHSSWGGTPAEAWTSAEMLSELPDFEPRVSQLLQHTDSTASLSQPAQHTPSVLYNAMINPLIPFKVKGAIWYQGESNASRAYQYRSLFSALINDWRHKWNDNIAFHFVQLANFQEEQRNPVEQETWPELREAQTMALQLPNTGMAVIIDIGEADDIHPGNKQDVGYRLALNALHKNYDSPTVPTGPLYNSMQVSGDSIIIQFDYAESGLKTSDGDRPKGFAIAGNDQVFHWADVILRGNEAVVHSNKVSSPKAVRYGWANNPIVNIQNEENLPASPFRTDDWQGITENSK